MKYSASYTWAIGVERKRENIGSGDQKSIENMGFDYFFTCFLLALCILSRGFENGVHGFACNWGTRSTHPLPPRIVVQLLKDNGFNKVKLFEADPEALKALGNSGIEVMVGIPNDLLASLATDVNAAAAWVSQNVSTYVSKYRVNIR